MGRITKSVKEQITKSAVTAKYGEKYLTMYVEFAALVRQYLREDFAEYRTVADFAIEQGCTDCIEHCDTYRVSQLSTDSWSRDNPFTNTLCEGIDPYKAWSRNFVIASNGLKGMAYPWYGIPKKDSKVYKQLKSKFSLMVKLESIITADFELIMNVLNAYTTTAALLKDAPEFEQFVPDVQGTSQLPVSMEALTKARALLRSN